MIKKNVFQTRDKMHRVEDELVERVRYLDMRLSNDGEFDEGLPFAWDELLDFWKSKKLLAVNNRLPDFVVGGGAS